MAWVATDDFNSYSNGDLSTLNGGSGWSAGWVKNGGSATLSVQSSVLFEGAKSLSYSDAGTSMFYYRQLTTAISTDGNIVYVAMRRTANNTGEASINIRTDSASRGSVVMRASGALELAGTTTVTLQATYSANTWYVIRLTINASADTITAAYATGAYGGTYTFSSESSAVSMTNSGDITRFAFTSDPSAATNYFDLITPTNPSVSLSASEVAGTPVETNSFTIGMTASEVAGAPIDSAEAKFGWSTRDKSSTSWTNLDKS